MRFRPWYVPALASLIFIAAAMLLIPWPGLQEDELYFARPLYSAGGVVYQRTLGHTTLPLMIMSYAGALKTWLYAGIFALWTPSVWSVRIPVVAAGVATIFLTWMWVSRIADRRAAAFAAILLGTDPMFLMTNTFDWGPVALQHLLLVGGLVALAVWLRGASKWFLALAFFLWGLGLWDKALTIWPLAGMAVAALCVYPRETIRRVRVREAAIAVLALAAGAAPLIDYNIQKNAATASENSHFSLSEIPQKLPELRVALNGSALFGYIVDPGKTAPGARRDFLIPALLVGLAGAVLLFLFRTPETRPILFMAITSVLIWLQMAVTHDAGGGAHHVVLLWPFPFVFLALVLSGLARRFPRAGPIAVGAGLGLIVAGNLRVTNEYRAELASNGTTTIWTDAIGPLSRAIAAQPVQSAVAIDWGCASALETLSEGKLHVDVGDIASPGVPTIQHVRARQLFPGVNDRVAEIGRKAGLTERVERTIADSHGRPIFEIVKFEKTEPGAVQAASGARATLSGLP